jgi:hypothetical protein
VRVVPARFSGLRRRADFRRAGKLAVGEILLVIHRASVAFPVASAAGHGIHAGNRNSAVVFDRLCGIAVVVVGDAVTALGDSLTGKVFVSAHIGFPHV